MKEYEAAINEYYSSFEINSLLYCWDIYSSYFDKLCLNYNDIRVLTNLAETNKWTHILDLDMELLHKKQVVVVTDAKLNIVHATQNIYDMNGYKPKEVIGYKPKMFQGKDTSKDTIAYISEAVANKISFEAIVLNYRKDGTPYNCYIKGFPVFNNKEKLINFIAYEREVA